MKKHSILILVLIIACLAFASCKNSDKKQGEGENQNAKVDKTKSDSTESDKTESDNTQADSTEADNAEENKLEVGPNAGNLAIGFELESFNYEETFKLEDYLGKNPIVINFFASWCKPCRNEMPELNEVYKDYKDKGLKVFAVNLGNGDNEEDVKKLIDDYLLEFPVLIDKTSSIGVLYRVRSIPVNVFIDKNGVITEYKIGQQSKESYEKAVLKIIDEDN